LGFVDVAVVGVRRDVVVVLASFECESVRETEIEREREAERGKAKKNFA